MVSHKKYLKTEALSTTPQVNVNTDFYFDMTTVSLDHQPPNHLAHILQAQEVIIISGNQEMEL